MPNAAQRSFSAGELAPALHARADLARYQEGLAACRNAVVRRTGGVQVRPGTTWQGNTKADGQARLIPCVFDDAQNYMLEFGNQYVRFWRDGALVQAAPTAWANATVYDLGESVTHSGTTYVCIQSHTSDVANTFPYTTLTLDYSGSVYNVVTNDTTGVVADGSGGAGTWVVGDVGRPFTCVIGGVTYDCAVTAYTDANTVTITIFEYGGTATPGTSPLWDDGLDNEPGIGPNWTDYWHALEANIYELPTPYATADLRRLQTLSTRDTLRLVHPDYEYQKLIRVAEAQWYFAVYAEAAALATPGSFSVNGTPTPEAVAWRVTARNGAQGLESVPTGIAQGDTVPSLFTYTLSWTAVSGATTYRVYRSDMGGPYGLLFETVDTAFTDDGTYSPDLGNGLPSSSADPTAPGDYPGVLGAYQQRILIAGSDNEPDVVYGSRVADPDNFQAAADLTSESAISWRQIGPRVIRPRHFTEVAQRLIQFANVGEYIIQGDDSGILGPGAINPQQLSANGAAAYPSPLVVDQSALYVQARGGIVRDLAADAGSDLTLMAAHLVDGYTVEEWAFQPTPDPVVWAVRDDGVLLSLTYERSTGILGWARHDTAGVVESVAVVPEGNADALYLIVQRTIDAATVRFVERMASRTADYADGVYADAAVVFTQPTGGLTLDHSGATFLAPDGPTSNVVATAAAGTFTAADDGRSGTLTHLGVDYTFTVTAVTDDTEVTITVDGATYPSPASIAAGAWRWDELPAGALDHLEAAAVSVLTDAGVFASPYNPDYDAVAVASGTIDLGDLATTWTRVVVGLPYVADIGTLDLERAGSSVREGTFKLTKLGLYLEDSLGCFAGPQEPTTATGLTLPGGGQLQPLPVVDANDNPTTDPVSGYRSLVMDAHYSQTGRVWIRHVDPTPLTILAIVPHGTFPRA